MNPPSIIPTTAAQRRKALVTNLAATFIIALIIFGLLALGRTIERRNQAFDDRGVPVQVQLTQIQDGIAYYRYVVSGSQYTGSSKVARHDQATVGDMHLARYLAEDPGRARLYPLDPEERRENERAFHGLAGLLGATAALIFVLRLVVRNGLSQNYIAAGLALLLTGVMLSTNFDAKVLQVQTQAFGARPLGMPVTWTVSLVELLLIGPALLLLFIQLLNVVPLRELADRAAMARRVLLGEGLTPKQRSARWHVLLLLGYLIALMLGWIAFADWKGI